MNALVLYARVCAITLLSLQLSLLLLRSFSCYNKKELFAFTLTLCYLGFKIIFPHVAYLNEISTFLVIWALGNYLAIILEDKKRDTWNVAFFCIIGVYVLLIVLGFKNSIFFALFYIFTAGTLFIYPLFSFIQYYKRTKYILILFLCIASTSALLSGGYEYLASLYALPFVDITLWIFIVIFLGTGYLLFQQGYLLSTELNSLYTRLTMQEKKLRQLSSKLSYTEQTLVIKDRFISLGLLAAGIIHEFKNILGLILSCAQFGQAQSDAAHKEQSLNMVVENARHGLESVIGLLEKVRVKDTMIQESINMKEFCNKLMKVVRANYRGVGINVIVDVKNNFSVSMRKADFEQAVLNLIRNAAEALKNSKKTTEKYIRIEIISEYNQGVVEITDNAGGLPSEIVYNIFEPHYKTKGSTGIGLYLTKMLAEQNGVQLLYESVKNGSMFKFIFSHIQNA
jgi:signal transduction histidine kinase